MTNSKNIAIGLLAIGFLLIGTLYLLKSTDVNSNYKDDQRKLDMELVRLDSILKSIDEKRDSLSIERYVISAKLDSLKSVLIDLSEERETVNKNRNESINNINDADLNGITDILTRHINRADIP